MKKLTIFAALCALVLGSCAENNLDGVTPENNITLPDLTAGFADDETKTYVHNNTYLRWHEADLITAFYGNSLNRQYKFKGKTGDNSGTFSLIPSGELGTGNDLGAIYAVYPYDENAGINDETRVISLTLPATQTYAENSFGKGANTMIAVTENLEDTFLGFKNACGYLKLKLYGEDVTLASVEVKGNNGEKIAGSATATMEFGGVPTLTMSADATTTVTLDCGEGVVLGATAETATELWIVLPETTFEDGITITATDTEGKVFEKSTTKTVAIVRNEIQPMAALNANFISKPASNEIWYTNGSTTSATGLYRTTGFGANIESNAYDAEKECWVITFDKDITTVGDYAFQNRTALTSVTIPDSITSIGSSAFTGCTSLASFTIPSSVSSVGSNAFGNCTSLKRVDIADLSAWCKISFDAGAANPLLNGAKLYLKGNELTDITIPADITEINYSFCGCTSLTSITIGNGVTSIGNLAFSGCTSLTSITIGNCVTSIGYRAFYGCSALKNVYCKATTPPALYDNYVFYGSPKFYVPASDDDSIINAYKTSWSNWAKNIEEYSF